MDRILGWGLAATLLAAPGAERPEAVVREFHEALAAGSTEAALALLLPGAVVFEAGGGEMSRDEYRSHHLEADMEFARATERQVLDQRVGGTRDVAWVLTRMTWSGSFRGRQIARRGTETAILERTAEGWRIRHLHWSSRAVPAGGG